MQTCPAGMAHDNQRIRDVVDDAVELDVATKMLGLEGRPTLQTAGLGLELHCCIGFVWSEGSCRHVLSA